MNVTVSEHNGPRLDGSLNMNNDCLVLHREGEEDLSIDVPDEFVTDLYRLFGESPDIWVLKIDEREKWCDLNILAKTKKLFGVYVFDKNVKTHCCEATPSYSLNFLGTEFEAVEGLSDDEMETLEESIRDGDYSSESFELSYRHYQEVDNMLTSPCKKYHLPHEPSFVGSYPLPVEATTSDEAIEEAIEMYHLGGL